MALSPKMKKNLVAFAIFDLTLVVVIVFVLILKTERDQIREYQELGLSIYPTANPIQEFQLNDQQGNSFSQQDLLGQWSLIFFGFTNCPDICPLTMSELKLFYARLAERGDLAIPRVILATVDPLRDTPEVMAEYLSVFNQDFIGLTGTDEELARLAGQLFVARGEVSREEVQEQAQDQGGGQAHSGHESHSTVEIDPEQDYLFEHSGHISVINPQGELHAVLGLPHRNRQLLLAYEAILTD